MALLQRVLGSQLFDNLLPFFLCLHFSYCKISIFWIIVKVATIQFIVKFVIMWCKGVEGWKGVVALHLSTNYFVTFRFIVRNDRIQNQVKEENNKWIEITCTISLCTFYLKWRLSFCVVLFGLLADCGMFVVKII